MRIVGGKWRGRALADLGTGDEAAHLRPSSDRFRETVFNILRHHDAPMEMRVLDLFAGTGALGFEALSRGAEFACFIDNGRKSGALIVENMKRLQSGAKAQLLRRDALSMGANGDEPFDLVFMDPPYGQSLGEKAITNAKEQNWLASEALVVWEDDQSPILPPFLKLVDQRSIGRAILTIAKYGDHEFVR